MQERYRFIKRAFGTVAVVGILAVGSAEAFAAQVDNEERINPAAIDAAPPSSILDNPTDTTIPWNGARAPAQDINTFDTIPDTGVIRTSDILLVGGGFFVAGAAMVMAATSKRR